MKWFIKTIFMFQACILATCLQYSYAFDLPDEALRLIAETTTDPCPICVEQKLKEAFAIMEARLQPGLVVETDEHCWLKKIDPKDVFEFSLTCYPSVRLMQTIGQGQKLPDVAFVFHTSEKFLVGISEKDYTDERIIDRFRKLPPGTLFKGQVRLISYKYGDGPSFNYYQTSNRVQIHCTILGLSPLVQ